MPFIKIWVHLVWATKNREPLLIQGYRQYIFNHIGENGRAKGVYVDCIGGGREHVHALVSLGGKQTIADVAHQLKGESSYWINRQGFLRGKFSWQDDYFAASVSKSALSGVREYISKQESHHKKVTFAEEYTAFMDRWERK